MEVTEITKCRVCQSTTLEEALSLGDMPLVNRFERSPHAGTPVYPLGITFCPKCTHVQLTHKCDPKEIFEDYIYFSSMSESVVNHGEALAERYASELSLVQADLVVELASNDGCILKAFQKYACTIGVEPAKNIAAVANKQGVPTVAEFFNSNQAAKLKEEYGAAKLIIARNVVAHVPDVVDFIAGACHWLADDGLLHVEVPYLGEMIGNTAFDQIYHEHLSYFSVTALFHLFHAAGLELCDIERLDLHGGSLIVRAKKRINGVIVPGTTRISQYLLNEQYLTADSLKTFGKRTELRKVEIPELLRTLQKDGKTLAGYGAAAKGVVLTNYCNIGTDLLPYVVDISPHKQNKWMPGSYIPVLPPEQLTIVPPDYLVVLAWNFFDEIKRQQQGFSGQGGKFVLPLPVPRIAV